MLRLHAARVRHAGLHHHHRKRPGHPAGQHHHHGERANATGFPSCTSCAGGWAAPTAAPTPTCWCPPDTELTEIARKRLAALKEFSDLGAGFKIAALDLELRGAGNLLGGEQHGHINAVGFDMYVQLLEETVRELKGEEVPLEVAFHA